MEKKQQYTFIVKFYTNDKNWRKPLKESIQQLANITNGHISYHLLDEEGRIKADVLLLDKKLV